MIIRAVVGRLSDERLAAEGERLGALRAGVEEDGPARAFVLVSPLGLDRLEEIKAWSGATDVEPFDGFRAVAASVYLKCFSRSAIYFSLAHDVAWGRAAPHDRGSILWLDRGHSRVADTKDALRRSFQSPTALLVTAVGQRLANLHAFHVPDVGAAECEARRVSAALRALRERAKRT